MGFGLSFYGFFVTAAIWMCLYFVWVAAADRLERGRSKGD
jgi:hypothetical protein